MFYLHGFDVTIQSVYKACYTPGRSERINTIDQLRECYLDFLGQYQTIKPNNSGDRFIVDDEVEARLSEHFAVSDPGDRQTLSIMGPPFLPDNRHSKIQMAREALDELLALDVDLRSVFELVVHGIIVRSHSGRGVCHGGSSSAAIGVIWLTVEPNMSKRGLQEIFIHELTHHLLYIDALNNTQFIYDEMFNIENFVTSAIFQKSMSVGKVIHSMIVSLEIILGRRKLQWTDAATPAHPKTEALIDGIRCSYKNISELDRFHDLTTPHMREILASVMRKCELASENTGLR